MLTYQINKEVLDTFCLPHQLYTLKELKLELLKKFNLLILLTDNMKQVLGIIQKTMNINDIVTIIINNHQYKKKISYQHYDYYQIPIINSKKIESLIY
jgi:hypothetical protein